MGINTGKIAYKIGFSSALNPDTISAYQEIKKWTFEGDGAAVYKLHKVFKRGYAEATKALMELKYELKMAKQNGEVN